MLNIEKCREVMGKDGEHLSDEEIERLRNSLEAVIEAILDRYFESGLSHE
jgi:hypothetical protein